MNIFKKLTAVLILFAMAVSLAACADGSAGPTEATSGGSVTDHTVTVKSQGGMPLAGIDVYVYADDSLTDLVTFGRTDDTGTAVLSMEDSGSYAISLSGVPNGYSMEAYYTFSDRRADIVLESSLVTDGSLSGASLGVGDVMYDFSVTTPAGETVTLSEMLAQKDMVLLNFWYTTCTYCVAEFPYMEQAYQQYSNDVGIIALNPLEQNAAISAFQAQYGLTFPMASCPAAWSATFGISGYPTSIVVDRYGVICLVEAGGITSLRPFNCMFDHFTADDYDQRLFSALSELVTTVKPTYTMASSEEVAAVLNTGDIGVTYRPETDGDSAEYSWPFIETQKSGETCLYATNTGIESSYAILYADVPLKAGQAVGFDYLASSERGCDVLHVIVNDEPIYQISGVSDLESWVSCYPWVAQEDGTIELALCYLKDGDTNEGDDTVYIKDLRILDAANIDTPTYIPAYVASTEDGLTYSYADIFLNEADGYYHVGSKDGPLLLADLMNYTQFNEEKTVWELVYNGDALLSGKNFYDDMVDYFSYASNSSLNGICTVNEELASWLKIVAESAGFDGTENEWLKICKYYQVYGGDGKQLEDPIKGLATFSAYEAKLGKNLDTNYFYYDRPIMPRGLLAAFTPQRSGVYRITSRTDSLHGVEGWIFGESRVNGYTYEHTERLWNDSLNVSMLYYMDAGETYYIDIAFWDLYETGYIYYDIEYVAQEYDVLRLGSPGFYTYDTNATGEAMYHLIAGGVDVVLGSDGIYYEDLGVDESGKQLYGSKLYADFTGITGVFSEPISTVPSYNEDGTPAVDEKGDPIMLKGIIDKGGFDFSKTEYDQYILSILKDYDNDPEKADAYLREYWGEDYETNAGIYQIEDVFDGKYHGRGQDYTSQILPYLDKIITTGPEELHGCVVVTEELAQLLQLLMDKYTFSGVDHSWTKLCYYYQHLGPQ